MVDVKVARTDSTLVECWVLKMAAGLVARMAETKDCKMAASPVEMSVHMMAGKKGIGMVSNPVVM